MSVQPNPRLDNSIFPVARGTPLGSDMWRELAKKISVSIQLHSIQRRGSSIVAKDEGHRDIIVFGEIKME